jgi:hypothetical protein
MFDWITAGEEPMSKADTLSADERRQLERLEAQVDAGITSVMVMIEAGRALATIRDRQLFRASAASWDKYVSDRFKITRRRADQIVAFAAVHDTIQETGTRVPALSEKAVRPLVGMDADTVKVVLQEAGEEAGGVTPSSIRKAAAKRKKPKAAKAPRPVRLKVPCAVVIVELNRKASAAGIDIEAALVAALEAHRRGRDGQAEAA